MKSEKDIISVRGNRGGSWYSSARGARASIRYWDAPHDRDSYLGFRLVRTVKVDKQVERWRRELEEGLFDEK